MATQQHAGYGQRGSLGKILVTVGSVALLADITFLAVPLERLVERLRDGLFGFVPALGLSFLNAARAIAFHQIDVGEIGHGYRLLFLGVARNEDGFEGFGHLILRDLVWRDRR